MSEDYEIGSIREVIARLRRAYGLDITGDGDVNTKLLATDLIVCMKAAGKPKDEFLYNMGELWDDIEMEQLQ